MIWTLLLAAQLNCSPVPDSTGNFLINPNCSIEEVIFAGRDLGKVIPGFHCPKAGPGDGTCVPWHGTAPDLGVTEFIPTASEIVATLLAQPGEDIAGGAGPNPDGILDVHIRLSGVPAPVTKIRIDALDNGGYWQTPPDPQCCWTVTVVVTLDPSVVDLYFNFWSFSIAYVLDLTFANGDVQTVQTVQGPADEGKPTPPMQLEVR